MKTLYSLFVVLALIVSCGELNAEVDGSWILDQEVSSASCEKLGAFEQQIACSFTTSIFKEVSISGDRVEMSGKMLDEPMIFGCSHDVSNQKFLCDTGSEVKYSLEGERLVLEVWAEGGGAGEGAFYKLFYNQK